MWENQGIPQILERISLHLHLKIHHWESTSQFQLGWSWPWTFTYMILDQRVTSPEIQIISRASTSGKYLATSWSWTKMDFTGLNGQVSMVVRYPPRPQPTSNPLYSNIWPRWVPQRQLLEMYLPALWLKIHHQEYSSRWKTCNICGSSPTLVTMVIQALDPRSNWSGVELEVVTIIHKVSVLDIIFFLGGGRPYSLLLDFIVPNGKWVSEEFCDNKQQVSQWGMNFAATNTQWQIRVHSKKHILLQHKARWRLHIK